MNLLNLKVRKKTKKDKIIDALFLKLPYISGIICILEYTLIPDNSINPNPMTYIYFIICLLGLYSIYLLYGLFKKRANNPSTFEKVRYNAPLYTGILLFLAFYDYLTLKTGVLTQPFVPCVNLILNAGIGDYKLLLDCAKNTLILLFLGYFIGVVLGLITGILCGYSKRVHYWVSPIISILGPIPTATWVPIMMVIASSLYAGSVFIIALGSWFAVTVATITGISNVDKDYFEAARTLGATSKQLISKIAIPGAVPSILQGCTQAMSSACVSILIAEMLGVKSGLGWYMTWQKSWASYDKMFAALIIICIVFIIVTKGLNKIKSYLLRWQVGEGK